MLTRLPILMASWEGVLELRMNPVERIRDFKFGQNHSRFGAERGKEYVSIKLVVSGQGFRTTLWRFKSCP